MRFSNAISVKTMLNHPKSLFVGMLERFAGAMVVILKPNWFFQHVFKKESTYHLLLLASCGRSWSAKMVEICKILARFWRATNSLCSRKSNLSYYRQTIAWWNIKKHNSINQPYVIYIIQYVYIILSECRKIFPIPEGM